MPIGIIIWLIITYIIYKKLGSKVAIVVFCFPFIYMLLLLPYALNIAEIMTEIININLIGIGASIIWCAILEKNAPKYIYNWLGIAPSILAFITYMYFSSH